MDIKKLFIFILAIAFAVLVHGCSTTPLSSGPSQIDKLIAQGTSQLTNQQYTSAQTTFESLLDPAQYSPSTDQANQARLGDSLAVLLNQVNILVTNIGSLFSLLGITTLTYQGDSPLIQPEFYSNNMTGINSLIAQFLQSFLMNGLYKAKGDLDAIIKSGDTGFTFRINSLPITVGTTSASYAIGDYGGMYDMEEVYYLDALLNGLDGAIDLVMSINLDMNIGSVVSYVMASGRLSNINVDTILEALGFIMVSSPPSTYNFLGIEPNDGTQNISASQLALTTALQDLTSGVVFIMKPPHKEAGNLITYSTDSKGNPTLYLTYQSLGASGYFTRIISIPITSTSQPNTSSGFITNIAARVENNINGGQPYTSFNNDMAPVVSMAAVTLLQSGLVQNLLKSLVTGLSPTLASMLSTILSSLSVNFLTNTLTSLIPGNMELDLGQFFKNPITVRSIMPAWVALGQSGTTLTGFTFTAPAKLDPSAYIVSTLILEYECPPSNINILYCTGTTFTPSAHFLGPDGKGVCDPDSTTPCAVRIGPIPKDPSITKAYLPFIAFRDPTLGKVLYLTTPTQTTEHNPSLYELNYELQAIGQTIFGLI